MGVWPAVDENRNGRYSRHEHTRGLEFGHGQHNCACTGAAASIAVHALLLSVFRLAMGGLVLRPSIKVLSTLGQYRKALQTLFGDACRIRKMILPALPPSR